MFVSPDQETTEEEKSRTGSTGSGRVEGRKGRADIGLVCVCSEGSPAGEVEGSREGVLLQQREQDG